MTEVNGDPEDLRDIKKIALAKGMIPYIPAHRE
jgi:hypothetical protein